MDQLSHRARTGAAAWACGLFFLLAAGALPGSAAAAATTTATAAAAGKRFAVVWRLRGDVAATGASAGAERKLREGDVVFVGDRVRAAPAAEAVLRTEDAGMVAVRPGAEFVAERFAAAGKPTDSFSVRLLSGSLRVITGWIGRLNRGGHQIVTPQATIGIRGTDHEPYVLSAEMARATSNREGTYDKVNRGGTTLQASGQTLDVDPGRVGFAPRTFKQRALLTLMLPVLLDKVPDFYVPGEFDAELDRYSQTAEEEGLRQLEEKRRADQEALARCAPADLARAWLDRLDGGIVRRDAPAIIALFAPEAAVRANVRSGDGSTTSIDLSRDEMAESTLAAVQSLEGYQHRRISVDASREESDIPCGRIGVKSVVIEQGRQAGKPYRFESLEEYVLELRDGAWLAIKAEATQR